MKNEGALEALQRADQRIDRLDVEMGRLARPSGGDSASRLHEDAGEERRGRDFSPPESTETGLCTSSLRKRNAAEDGAGLLLGQLILVRAAATSDIFENGRAGVEVVEPVLREVAADHVAAELLACRPESGCPRQRGSSAAWIIARAVRSWMSTMRWSALSREIEIFVNDMVAVGLLAHVASSSITLRPWSAAAAGT